MITDSNSLHNASSAQIKTSEIYSRSCHSRMVAKFLLQYFSTCDWKANIPSPTSLEGDEYESISEERCFKKTSHRNSTTQFKATVCQRALHLIHMPLTCYTRFQLQGSSQHSVDLQVAGILHLTWPYLILK